MSATRPQVHEGVPSTAFEVARSSGINLPERRPWDERRLAVVALQIAALCILLGLWELAARQGWIDQFFWSRPSAIASTTRKYLADGRLLEDAYFTVRAALLGFVAGTLIGAVIGLSLWWSRLAARVSEPFIIAFHAVPKVALAPLLILMFGIGLKSKVVIVVMMTMVTTTLSSHAGVKSVDLDLLALFHSLGASRIQTFRKLVVPSAMPWIVSALRINIGLSVTGAVVGEMVASEHGLGHLIFYAASIYDASLVWTATLALCAIAVTMFVLVGRLERVLLKGVLHSDRPPRR